ncbi:MAG: ATP-binding protein [Polyangiales bacterium]
MTLPAFIALCAALAGVLFAALSLGLSAAPGWRPLRWYAFASLLAAAFSGFDAVTTFDLPLVWYQRCARANVLVAGLHGACWYLYYAGSRDRPLHRGERAAVAAAVVLGALGLVPELMVSDHVVARAVPWLGVLYRDAVPTPLGSLTLAYFSTALGVLGVRLIRDQRPGARAEGVALLALAGTALYDTAVFSAALPLPYLLNPAFFAMLLAVGASITARFVRSARALDESLDALRRTREALVQRERLAALGEMSAMVAHEVRNPLAVMFNALATVRRGPLEEQQAMLLGVLDEEARRLDRLVTALLDYARPRTAEHRPTDLASLVNSAADAARTAQEDPCPALHIELCDGVHEVTLDAERMRRALLNLIDNALRAPGCRSVRVRAATEGDALLLEVQDDGEGVPEPLRDKVFAPFFTTRAAGTGLGLAIVQNVAAAHGGTVSCRETPGGGATFALRLPLDPAVQLERASRPSIPEAAGP